MKIGVNFAKKASRSIITYNHTDADEPKTGGYFGSDCATDFGGFVPAISVQTVPIISVRFVPVDFG